MSVRDIVKEFVKTFNISQFDWAKETSCAKKLLANFDEQDVLYSFEYYSHKTFAIHSLGFFVYQNYKAMGEPIRDRIMKEKAKQQIEEAKKMEGDDLSGQRNAERVERSRKASSGEESYFSLFEECR